MDSTKTIVEINGVKMELNLRTAKVERIDTFKIGSKIKLLRKPAYSDHVINIGVIVGFEAFKALPSIQIAYLDAGYGAAPIKFLVLNAQTKDVELIAADADDILGFDTESISQALDRDIEAKRLAHATAVSVRDLFHKHFGAAVSLEVPEAVRAE